MSPARTAAAVALVVVTALWLIGGIFVSVLLATVASTYGGAIVGVWLLFAVEVAVAAAPMVLLWRKGRSHVGVAWGVFLFSALLLFGGCLVLMGS